METDKYLVERTTGLKDVKIIGEDLVKKYGSIVALNNVSFKIYSGEIYGLIGPNGAGKTTLIKSIAGAVKLNHGHVLVDGYDSIREWFIVRNIIGVVPELPSLYPELSVRDNLLFIARIRGMKHSTIGEKIREYSRLLGVEEYLDRRYGGLSKGLKRRIDILASLIHDPDILLLDEPTSGLDIMVAGKIRFLVKKLASMGKTILLSTHYIDEAMLLSNHLLVLYKGRKIYEGGPDKLVREIGASKKILVRINSAVDNEDELLRKFREAGVLEKISIYRDVLTATTNNPLEAIEHVKQILGRHGYVINDIEIHGPSWEDVLGKLYNSMERERG